MKTLAQYMSEKRPGRRRAQPEREVQDRILAALQGRGLLAFHIPNHGRYNPKTRQYTIVDKYHVPGIPDIAVVLPNGRMLWIEVKSMAGTQSVEQMEVEKRLRAMGHPYVLARTLDDVLVPMRQCGWIN